MSLSQMKIICPIDFDAEHALKAVDEAAYFASMFKTELVLMHSIVPSGLFYSKEDELRDRKHTGMMLDEIILDKVDRLLIEMDLSRDLPVSKVIKVGKPSKTIVEAATEILAGFVVMGINTTSRDSIVQNVMDESPCPVLLIRGDEVCQGFKKIVLPIDVTRDTQEKREITLHLAKRMKSKVYAISIVSNKDEDVHNFLKKQLKKTETYFTNHGIEVETTLKVVTKGNIEKHVLDFATKIGAELIVIMIQQSDSKTGPARFIVRESEVPVLCINPREQMLSDKPIMI